MNTRIPSHKIEKRFQFFVEVCKSIPKDAEIKIDRRLFLQQRDEPLTFNCPLFGSRYYFDEDNKEWKIWQNDISVTR